MNLFHLVIVFAGGMVASSFGTLIGGTSLITIPTLILVGLPPHTAIGTDLLGLTGMAIAGWYKFHQKGMLNYRIGVILACFAMLGTFLGANLVLQISQALLKKVIAGVTVSVLIFVMIKREVGTEEIKCPTGRIRHLLGYFLSFLVGGYRGFYGPMSGTFLLYILLFLFGQTFLRSAATIKIAGLSMTLTGGLVFAAHGKVHYGLAIAMFLGCFRGAYLGTHYADKIGNIWIRRLFIAIVLVMVIKLLVP